MNLLKRFSSKEEINKLPLRRKISGQIFSQKKGNIVGVFLGWGTFIFML